MKTRITTFALLMVALVVGATSVISYTLRNPDGSAYTNPAIMTVYPPATQAVVVVGTNVVIGGGYPITLTPNSAGRGTNTLLGNQYQVYMPSNNIQFLVNIPDGITNDIFVDVIGAPVVFAGSSFYSYFTNAFGYAPVTNSAAGVIAALGYTPATNGGAVAYSQLPYTPPTNNYAGLTNVLGFAPATNTPAGILFAEGFQPATNTIAGVTNLLGFVPAPVNPMLSTNIFLTTVAGITNASGYVTNLSATLATNIINYQHP